MTPLKFKGEVEFQKDETYSVCLRGARRHDTSGDFDISIYTPEYWEKPKFIANVVSQNHYSFYNLIDEDFTDNYDSDARTYGGLYKAMQNVYPDFKDREVVTILRFKVC
jgi:hypothetical protein